MLLSKQKNYRFWTFIKLDILYDHECMFCTFIDFISLTEWKNLVPTILAYFVKVRLGFNVVEQVVETFM